MLADALPEVKHDLQETPIHHLKIACNVSRNETIGVMVWNTFIVLVCCIFAFLTRKLPENYNESKFITFCSFSSLVVLLAFSTTHLTVDDVYFKATYISLGLIVNATVALLCLYAVKIYAIYYVNKDDIHVHRFASGRSSHPSVSFIDSKSVNFQRTSVTEQNVSSAKKQGIVPETSVVQTEQSSGFASTISLSSVRNLEAIDEEDQKSYSKEVSDAGSNPEMNCDTKPDEPPLTVSNKDELSSETTNAKSAIEGQEKDVVVHHTGKDNEF